MRKSLLIGAALTAMAIAGCAHNHDDVDRDAPDSAAEQRERDAGGGAKAGPDRGVSSGGTTGAGTGTSK